MKISPAPPKEEKLQKALKGFTVTTVDNSHCLALPSGDFISTS